MDVRSVYECLEPSSSEIRLIRLLPLQITNGGPVEPWYHCTNLECTFETVTLASAPAYEALSYAWGDEDPTVQILLNGKKFWTRPNLAYALASLRISEPRVLWIDALCIDQENPHERSHQVRLMGQVYSQAERVLVWLGRPSSSWDSMTTGALSMAKRLGECPPTSKLPTPPPVPSADHEERFDEWLKSLATNRNSRQQHQGLALKVDTSDPQFRLNLQIDRWSLMKTRRERHGLERHRLPEMFEDLHNFKASLAQKQRELQKIEALVFAQRKLLEELRSLESQYQDNLIEPQRRLLQSFQERQEQAFREVNTMVKSKLPEAEAVHREEAANLQRKIQNSENDANDGNTQFNEADKLFHKILADLGLFQKSIAEYSENLERNAALMSPSEWNEKATLLEKMQQVDVGQRHGLNNLTTQLKAWHQQEDQEEEAAVLVLESQVLEFQRHVEHWRKLQEQEIKRLGSLPTFMSKQYLLTQDLTRDMSQTLQGLQLGHDRAQSEAAPFECRVDPFLTDEEIKNLAAFKNHRRDVLQRRLILRDLELRRWENEAVVRQYDKWRWELYNMQRQLPNMAMSREESMSLQNGFVKIWLEMRDKETTEWQSLLSQTDTAEQCLSIDLLSLESICYLPYWKRLWIVQEVLLAKQLVLCFGDNRRTTMGWDVVTKARCSLDNFPDLWELSPVISGPINKIREAFPLQLDRLRDDCGRYWPLHSLVDITKNSLCRDPRDKIYGLLGLARDFRAEDFEISYKKTVETVYQDAIRCYYSKQEDKEGSPSLIKFSQLLQLSLKGHDGAQNKDNSPSSPSLDETVLPSSGKTFHAKAMLTGPVIPIENLFEERDLIKLQQRDWISILVEYLDDSGLQKTKAAIEEELVYLDSIKTNFSMPTSSSAYAVEEKETPNENNLELPLARAPPNKRQETQFFITGEGKVGISSTCIREGDLLCEFQDSRLGVILRRRGHCYLLVSKTVISSISVAGKMHKLRLEGRLDPSMNHMTSRTEGEAETKEQSSPIVHVVLDAASLHRLTMPLVFSTKHENREPPCIHAASFGWYEFTRLGLDVRHSSKRPGVRNIRIQDESSAFKQDPPPPDATEVTMGDEVLSRDRAWAPDDKLKRMAAELLVNLEINETYSKLRHRNVVEKIREEEREGDEVRREKRQRWHSLKGLAAVFGF